MHFKSTIIDCRYIGQDIVYWCIYCCLVEKLGFITFFYNQLNHPDDFVVFLTKNCKQNRIFKQKITSPLHIMWVSSQSSMKTGNLLLLYLMTFCIWCNVVRCNISGWTKKGEAFFLHLQIENISQIMVNLVKLFHLS